MQGEAGGTPPPPQPAATQPDVTSVVPPQPAAQPMESATATQEITQPTPPKEPTAADRAVAKALERIDLSQEDLAAAGVTPDQLATAKAKAEERIRAHHAELESQDPLTRIDTALKEAALTEKERELVDINRRQFVGYRNLLAEAAKNPGRDARGGLEVVWYRDENRLTDPRVAMPILSGPYKNSEGNVVIEAPSHELQERVLRNLGVLEGDQTLGDLYAQHVREFNSEKSFEPTPPGPLHETTTYGAHYITRLPTNIDGVEARVNYAQDRRSTEPQTWVKVAFSAKALQKIQPPVQSRW